MMRASSKLMMNAVLPNATPLDTRAGRYSDPFV
jgi:hypothetical protein